MYGCGEQEAGVASGWNLWVWLLGVVVRRYIDFLILLIPTPLVSVLFFSSIPTFCSFKKMFFIYIYRTSGLLVPRGGGQMQNGVNTQRANVIGSLKFKGQVRKYCKF